MVQTHASIPERLRVQPLSEKDMSQPPRPNGAQPDGSRPSPKPSRQMIPSKRSADTQEDAWVADEDRFVLQQAKKKAAIRVKGGRAQPIDWLTVTLSLVDPTRNPLGDEVDVAELDLVDPEGVFDGLNDAQLAELEKSIDTYCVLETSKSNQDYWIVCLSSIIPSRALIANGRQTMKTICKDRRQRSGAAQPTVRGVNSIASDLDNLLGPKTYEELEKLEKQIRTKLQSNEPIDTDYWEHLLRSLLVWKAKAKLRKVSQSILAARLDGLRKQEAERASDVRNRLQVVLSHGRADRSDDRGTKDTVVQPQPDNNTFLDPEPLLRLRQEDKALEAVTARDFAASTVNGDRFQSCTSYH